MLATRLAFLTGRHRVTFSNLLVTLLMPLSRNKSENFKTSGFLLLLRFLLAGRLICVIVVTRSTRSFQWVITVKGDDEDVTSRQRKQPYQDVPTDIRALIAALGEAVGVLLAKVFPIEMVLHFKD